VICDDAVRELLEHVSVHLPQTSDYFRQHVVPKLRHNMEVLGRHSWIRRGWNNNNAESYNHVLKSKIEWRTIKRMMDLIECVHTLVAVQMKDLRRALHDCSFAFLWHSGDSLGFF